MRRGDPAAAAATLIVACGVALLVAAVTGLFTAVAFGISAPYPPSVQPAWRIPWEDAAGRVAGGLVLIDLATAVLAVLLRRRIVAGERSALIAAATGCAVSVVASGLAACAPFEFEPVPVVVVTLIAAGWYAAPLVWLWRAAPRPTGT